MHCHSLYGFNNVSLVVGVCGKANFGSDSDIKIPTIQKFVNGFPTETVCNPQFKLKVTKTTLIAFNVQIKNVLKHDRNQV